jgi:sporulation integral membrane protein YtvI
LNNDKKKKFLIYIAYITVILVLAYLAVKICLGYMLPFIIGIIIAVLVQKPAVIISDKVKIKTGTAAFLLVVFIYLALLLLLFFFGSRVYFAAVNAYYKAPQILEKVSDVFENVSDGISSFASSLPGDYGEHISHLSENFANTAIEKITEVISSLFTSIVSGMPGFLLSVVVTVITGCYVAKDFASVRNALNYALKPEYKATLLKIVNITKENVLGLIKGYFILSLIAFAELTIGFFILGVSSPFKVALITSLVDLLPVFGSGTVLVPWAVLKIIRGEYLMAAGLIILFIIVTVVRNVTEPKIVGKQVGIHPLIALASIFLGLKLFGVAGIILLPLTVTVALRFSYEKVTRES